MLLNYLWHAYWYYYDHSLACTYSIKHRPKNKKGKRERRDGQKESLRKWKKRRASEKSRRQRQRQRQSEREERERNWNKWQNQCRHVLWSDTLLEKMFNTKPQQNNVSCVFPNGSKKTSIIVIVLCPWPVTIILPVTFPMISRYCVLIAG